MFLTSTVTVSCSCSSSLDCCRERSFAARFSSSRRSILVSKSLTTSSSDRYLLFFLAGKFLVFTSTTPRNSSCIMVSSAPKFSRTEILSHLISVSSSLTSTVCQPFRFLSVYYPTNPYSYPSVLPSNVMALGLHIDTFEHFIPNSYEHPARRLLPSSSTAA